MFKSRILFILGLCGLIAACQPSEKQASADLQIEYEKIELDNGLDVIFHVDRSDPVVAVALTAHVGSAREVQGRTGFAHLFEHLLFLESENLGKGGLDKMSARIGGSGANGSTSRDRTNYFQTVPKDALEKMIWAEADKLGWFINTVTEPVLAKEKQVVKNEKRQSVDNRPYGHNSYVIDKALYPEDHPYNWQVIGSLEDLQNATLADVKTFFKRWYVPNNVTLVVSGDFEVAQAKEWVHKYFDEIAAGETIEPLAKQAGVVEEEVRLYYEDNFARLPSLTLVFPSVELYHPDAYALDILSEYLSSGKKAPLYQVLVEEKNLTSGVRMFNRASELAGQLQLNVQAYADKDLDSVLTAIEVALDRFEANGISDKDLNRIKAGSETDFYNGLSSVLGKGFQLAQYNIFAGDPGFINQDIKNQLAVTKEEVMRVYKKYVAGKPFIATSFVPLGKTDQALTGSTFAEVVEEAIVQGAEERFDASLQAEYEPAPSTFDRSIEPPSGTPPTVQAPAIWEATLDNGLEIFGIESKEVPLVQFNIVIKGGQLLEPMDKLGLANMTARLMNRGTRNKTPEELEEAIQALGASISISAGKENIRISANTLARNYEATLVLVKEMLLEPRWDQKEFELLKESTLSSIQQQASRPNTIAALQYDRLLYGEGDIRAQNLIGTEATVQALSLEDLMAYYKASFAPNISTMHLVGAIDQTIATASLAGLESAWSQQAVELPVLPAPSVPERAQVYFYDVPNAKQSVIRFGKPAMAATDADYYPATVMNYILGGGGFASQLTQQLREGKGYTYGIRSRFSGSATAGDFSISSSVRTNVTLESAQLVKEILQKYGPNYTEKDLETTKSALIKSQARAFETSGAKLGFLENISAYGWSPDYIKERAQVVEGMTIDKINALADQYINPDQMIWLVIGDAKTQLSRMKELGYGEPILLNEIKALDQ